MKSGVKSFAAILIIAACLKAEAQFSTSAGSGGVAITPRGMSFKNRPEMRISRNSVSLSQTSRSLQPKDAVKILKSTNLVTGAKLGDNGEISQQTLALASLLFYPSRETALASFVEIFNSAENAEGKIYGAMGIYYFEGRNALEKILESSDKTRKISVLMKSNLHSVEIGKFFEVFLRDSSLFLPSQSVLGRSMKITTGIGTRTHPYIAPPPVIILPEKK